MEIARAGMRWVLGRSSAGPPCTSTITVTSMAVETRWQATNAAAAIPRLLELANTLALTACAPAATGCRSASDGRATARSARDRCWARHRQARDGSDGLDSGAR